MDIFQNHIEHSKYSNNIYLVGNYEERVTVHSQQIRAANLIFSLVKLGILKETSKIAIIGAGASGLTAAACSALLGSKNITIFEQGSNILPLWGNCSSRWLHPNIFNWPHPNWRINYTSLPILNWTANTASNVAKQMIKEWDAVYNFYRPSIKLNLDCKAKIIRDTNKISWGNGKNESFDLIFLCVGFGRDGSTNDEDTCYWANDNITSLRTRKDKYFLSGSGDGGISDLLRLRLKNFDLDYLKYILEMPEIKKLESKIQLIEEKALTINIKSGIDAANQFLQTQYEKLKSPKLKKELTHKIRLDTSVIFHSKNASLVNIKSFPLNRFLLSRYLQISDNGFRFVHGEIMNLDALKQLEFSRGNFNIIIKDERDVNSSVVITRHGPVSPLQEPGLKWIDESQKAKEIKSKNKLDQTGQGMIFTLKEFHELAKDIHKIEESMNRQTIALAIIKHKSEDKYLFTERRLKESFLSWSFPSKRINAPTVDTKRALTMECEKQTGIKPQLTDIIGRRLYPESGYYLEYWYGVHDQGSLELIDESELLQVEWLTGEEIVMLSIDLYEPLKKLLLTKNG